MSFFSRLLGYASQHEAAGETLSDPHPLELRPTCDAAALLRALPILFPASAFLYCEGTQGSFHGWLEKHAIPPPLKLALGTIWPRPNVYHVPLDPVRLEEAAELVEREGICLPCFHLHVHDGQRVWLEWHDAFCDDPLHLASSLPRDRVETFARAIGAAPPTTAS